MKSKNEKPKRGVLIGALKHDGLVRVTMNDVVQKGSNTTHWDMDCFITSKDYEEKCFDELDFDEKELADFGHYVLSRLYAFKQRDEL